ncbi:MAG: hypothetical protein Q7T37_01385 [bacterium]|nr:hypothetical protein [bacterium]MDO8742286.1 hypothetical protein [bacterium]
MNEEDEMISGFDPLTEEEEDDLLDDEESEFSLDEEGEMRGGVGLSEEEEKDY